MQMLLSLVERICTLGQSTEIAETAEMETLYINPKLTSVLGNLY